MLSEIGWLSNWILILWRSDQFKYQSQTAQLVEHLTRGSGGLGLNPGLVHHYFFQLVTILIVFHKKCFKPSLIETIIKKNQNISTYFLYFKYTEKTQVNPTSFIKDFISTYFPQTHNIRKINSFCRFPKNTIKRLFPCKEVGQFDALIHTPLKHLAISIIQGKVLKYSEHKIMTTHYQIILI